jgi:hypothetical protein
VLTLLGDCAESCVGSVTGDIMIELTAVSRVSVGEVIDSSSRGEIAAGTDCARQAIIAPRDVIPSADELKKSIVEILESQGYVVKSGQIEMPEGLTKDDYRRMNQLAVSKKLAVSTPGLRRHEHKLINYIANGWEVCPEIIRPKLVLVQPDSEEELLFRYASLHWSIPVSSGYGRRLRFLVFDESNGKLIGLFGLGDPVFSLRDRDEWIGWDAEAKKFRMYHLMDAFVLGAVPPYSALLCGKLVALVALSNEVQEAFRSRYADQVSLIRKEKRKPVLALVTTTSALGRSSIYNRIRINGFDYWTSVGFTRGSGDFHFSNGVYAKMRAYVEAKCTPTAKHSDWGTGFRNRREVIRKCISSLGLSSTLIYHGIRREIFAAPLGSRAREFLCGKSDDPELYDWSVDHLFNLFRDRWLLPRASRNRDYLEFDNESYLLWPKVEGEQEEM